MILSIIAVVLVFAVLVAVHELGHMLAAKACGVAVPDFSIGFGPRLFGFKRAETEYNVRAIPLGGFCAVAGMGDDPADAPGAKIDSAQFPASMLFQNKNKWQQSFILVAGAGMNLVLAALVALSMGFVGFPVNAVVIQSVAAGSPAAAAGLIPGDWIQEIDGERLSSTERFAEIIRGGAGSELELQVKRGEELVSLAVIPQVREVPGYEAGQASIGVSYAPIFTTTTISLVQPKTVGYTQGLKIGDKVTHVNGEPVYNGFELLFALAAFNEETLEPVNAAGQPLSPEGLTPVLMTVDRGGQPVEISLPGDTTMISLGIQFQPVLEKLPPAQAIVRSIADAKSMTVAMLMGFKMLFTPQGVKSVSGPVGIMSLIGQSAQSGWFTFLQMVILINVNLALLNLLPLPALDGGRLVFVALKGIGIRISQEREGLVHMVGMVMLLGLILLISIVDVAALFGNVNR